MEDRRCRKVMALCLTTVIILSVFVQSAYAGPEKATDKLYSRVLDFKRSFLVGMVSDVKESILSQAQDNRIVQLVVNKISSKEVLKVDQTVPDLSDDIVIVVEQIPLDKAKETNENQKKTAQINENGPTGLQAAKKQADHQPEPEDQVNQNYSAKKGDASLVFSRSLGKEILKEDIELLARIIHAEARGESFEGQIAVGAVVLNRVRHPQFPKTIKEVVYQPGQFTAVDDKQILLKPNQNAYLAAQAALEGQDPSQGAIFYYNPKIAKDKWIKTRSTIRVIGNHQFCV